ncbi:hypothetical protein AJ80_06307 [Polytolypa hystricis UAMH7299]|uniref:Uncharacterized protein n=1 Tax=Polytolypa hystricis (strain UAMH7299) TaxID=1447883 RepID=A0A2B7XXZ7_POLH7|nr:hypothetical protein AJ80_06307 [Polytolypa hystricis UAMH7299]
MPPLLSIEQWRTASRLDGPFGIESIIVMDGSAGFQYWQQHGQQKCGNQGQQFESVIAGGFPAAGLMNFDYKMYCDGAPAGGRRTAGIYWSEVSGMRGSLFESVSFIETEIG